MRDPAAVAAVISQMYGKYNNKNTAVAGQVILEEDVNENMDWIKTVAAAFQKAYGKETGPTGSSLFNASYAIAAGAAPGAALGSKAAALAGAGFMAAGVARNTFNQYQHERLKNQIRARLAKYRSGAKSNANEALRYKSKSEDMPTYPPWNLAKHDESRQMKSLRSIINEISS